MKIKKEFIVPLTDYCKTINGSTADFDCSALRIIGNNPYCLVFEQNLLHLEENRFITSVKKCRECKTIGEINV